MDLAREIQQKYKLGETNFSEWNLHRQNLSFQTLDGSDFSQADLSDANLSSASLKNTNFHLANLSCSNCSNADFSESDLTGANLTVARLSGANFLNATYDESTQFPQGFDPLLSGAILNSQIPNINLEITEDSEQVSEELLDSQNGAETQSPPILGDLGGDRNEAVTSQPSSSKSELEEILSSLDSPSSSSLLNSESLGEAETQCPPIYSPEGHSRKGDREGDRNEVETSQTASNQFPEESLPSLHSPPRPPILGGSEVQSPPILGDLGGDRNEVDTAQTPASNKAFEQSATPAPEEESINPTLIVSPAPDTKTQPVVPPKPRKRRKILLIVVTALLMPILGGSAYIIYNLYQNFQLEQSILTTVKSHRDRQDYNACLTEISQAEEAQVSPTPFSNFEDQLNTIKETCQEKFAAQQMNKGTEQMEQERYEDAIATLSTIPETTESYVLAQSQINIAGQKHCDNLEDDARDSSTDDQFYSLIEKGQSLPTKAAIASECKTQMANLQQKWEENIPTLNDANALLKQGDCDAGRSRAKSLGKSIFRKWQRTSEQLLDDVADCRVPINITTTLRGTSSTHTFKGVTGQSLKIDLSSSEFDTFVTLLDSNGNKLGEHDDILRGVNKNSLLKLTLKQTGEFTVKVSAYKNKGTGSYRLKVSR